MATNRSSRRHGPSTQCSAAGGHSRIERGDGHVNAVAATLVAGGSAGYLTIVNRSFCEVEPAPGMVAVITSVYLPGLSLRLCVSKP